MLKGDRSDAAEVAELVRRAAAGDHDSWERLVDKFARLIWAITRDFKLGESDAADVAQATWLRLLEHIDRIEDPERVGSWLATTARNQCLRSLAARKRVVLAHDEIQLEGMAAHQPDVDEGLLAAERAQVVRAALTQLPIRWQQLLWLLISRPAGPHAELSRRLDLPLGSVGPTRRPPLAQIHVLLL